MEPLREVFMSSGVMNADADVDVLWGRLLLDIINGSAPDAPRLRVIAAANNDPFQSPAMSVMNERVFNPVTPEQIRLQEECVRMGTTHLRRSVYP